MWPKYYYGKVFKTFFTRFTQKRKLEQGKYISISGGRYIVAILRMA
jgi:hypothetical protein